MPKKILIIGGGIAGLSAGCYAQMNGYQSEIFEMNAIAGGLCTGWKRKGYTFDGCLHWLVGSDPSSSYYPLWEEIGAVQGKKMVTYDFFTRVVDEADRSFTVYTDPDRFGEEMLAIAPEDKKQIKRIVRDIKILMKNEMPPEISLKGIWPTLRSIWMIYKYRKPIRELAGKFTNPVLREFFINGLDWGETCSAFLLWTLALMATKKAGYPIGGSLEFIKSIGNRYHKLGGFIHFKSRVTGILVEGNRAVGIQLDDGSEYRGDVIISAADGHTTIFNWLQGKYTSPAVVEAYSKYILFPPLVYLSLGVDADYSKEPFSQNIAIKRPFTIGPDEIRYLYYRIYNMDPTMAPPGKSVFTFMITTDFDYWQGLTNDREAYVAEKKRIADAVIDNLNELYPGFSNQVEVVDVATPNTFVRHSGNWRGSYEGWLMDQNSWKQRNLMTLPGLGNFYMIGHWVAPGGGLPSGLITGRMAVKKICKEDRKKFITSNP
ncbi:MAG: NAD(P)/FAD-dependent oxidoreductase [Deltaproteobacteria bacterium]|nr:NAD(P)/FAD-dependent oxidoreductase [Deltaproteobacteria bacterium]